MWFESIFILSILSTHLKFLLDFFLICHIERMDHGFMPDLIGNDCKNDGSIYFFNLNMGVFCYWNIYGWCSVQHHFTTKDYKLGVFCMSTNKHWHNMSSNIKKTWEYFGWCNVKSKYYSITKLNILKNQQETNKLKRW